MGRPVLHSTPAATHIPTDSVKTTISKGANDLPTNSLLPVTDSVLTATDLTSFIESNTFPTIKLRGQYSNLTLSLLLGRSRVPSH